MFEKFIKIILVSSLFNLTACAAMFNGTKDNVSVRSNIKDADIYVNEMYLGKNNAFTTIPKKGDYLIRVSKKGCQDKTMPITRSFDPLTLLGLAIDFGIISILVIDGAATGAITKADQTNFVVDPEC